MIVLILHLLYNWSLGWKGWVQSEPYGQFVTAQENSCQVVLL